MRDDLAALLAANFPEAVLPADAATELARWVVVRRFARGAEIIAPGVPTPALFGVLSGEVEVSFVTADGAASVVAHVPSPHLFGLASFASGLPSSYQAVATRVTRVALFGPAAYTVLIDQVPGVARALIGDLARWHDSTLRLLQAARHASATERFTLALAQLQREGRVQRTDAQGWRWLRVTQAELAALAGLSRQTVNELVAALAQQARLRPGYGGVWLPPV